MRDRGGRPSARAGLIGLVFVAALFAVVVALSMASGDREAAPTSTVPEFASRSTTTSSEPAPSTSTSPTTSLGATSHVAGQPVPLGGGWTEVSTGPAPPERVVSVLAAADRFVVLGPAAGGSGVSFRGGSWTDVAQAPIAFGAHSAAAWTGNEVAVISGAAAAWNPDSDTWRPLSYPPTGTASFGQTLDTVWTGYELHAVGLVGDGTNDMFAVVYEGGGLTCCRVVPDPPFAATELHLGWDGEEVLAIGSVVDADGSVMSGPSFASLDPTTDTWTPLPPPPLADAGSLAITDTGGYLMVVDARGNSAQWHHRDGGWKSLPRLPGSGPRCVHDLAATIEAVYVVGCGGSVVRWTDVSGRWTELVGPAVQPLGPGACGLAAIPGIGSDRLHVWCGEGADAASWVLDGGAGEASRWGPALRDDRWEVLPNPAADRLDSTTLVWSGTELLWFGGHGIEEESFLGWGYEPATGTRHRIAPAPYPGRYGQVAVWTDDEMLVYFGAANLWNPTTRTWREAAPTDETRLGSPHPVWTGDEVLLVGSAERPTNDAIAYDPDADTWRPLPRPPGRAIADPAVGWSGERLYVMRGWETDADADGVLGSRTQIAAAYDPGADGWFALPALPGDVSLSGTVGDWVGDQFVVVGANWAELDHSGDLEGVPPIAGVAFEPGTDSWRRIATPPLPVWPGEGLAGSLAAVAHRGRLAVLFPADYFGESATVGLYDPREDRWELHGGAPSSAYSPAIVSAGSSIAYLTPEGTVLLHEP